MQTCLHNIKSLWWLHLISLTRLLDYFLQIVVHTWSWVKHIFIIYFDETNLRAKYILYLKHTHTKKTTNETCLLSLKNDKKTTKDFFFPNIYPDTASSEIKQLEGEI